MTSRDALCNELDRLHAEYLSLLALVARLKAGGVSLEDVEVDLAAASWRLAAGGISPAGEIVRAVSMEQLREGGDVS